MRAGTAAGLSRRDVLAAGLVLAAAPMGGAAALPAGRDADAAGLVTIAGSHSPLPAPAPHVTAPSPEDLYFW